MPPIYHSIYPTPEVVLPKAVGNASGKRDWLMLAFSMLVFILPLWPGIAELKIGPLPNLAPPRVIRLVLLLFSFLYFFLDKNRAAMFGRRLKENWQIVVIFLIFYAWRFVSGFWSQSAVLEIYALIKNDILAHFLIFFITLLAVRDERDINRIVHIIVAAGLLAAIVALVEFRLARNLFINLIPVTDDYVQNVLVDKSRDGFYRAQGTFEHPLLLGEFFVMIMPWAWHCFRRSEKLRWKFLAVLTGIFGLGAAYVSGTRSALILTFVMMIGMFFWEFKAWLKTSTNRPLQYLLLLQLPLIFFLLGGAAIYLKSVASGTTSITRMSANVRLEMLQQGVPKVIDSPFIGYGLGEATNIVTFIGQGGVKTLDNYYLLIALESGLFVSLLFAFLLLYHFFLGVKIALKGDKVKGSYAILLCLSVLGYMLMMGIHALPDLSWFLFAIFGMLLVLKEKSVADSSLPATP